MACGRERPDDHIQGVTDSGAESIDEPSCKKETDRIGQRKGGADLTVLLVRPSDLAP
jgi:hypothetical protein